MTSAGNALGKHWRAPDGAHIDVRGLQAPDPMVAIIELLEQHDAGDRVIVHHFREPLYLYPELAERGWAHKIVAGDPGEVRILLTRRRR